MDADAYRAAFRGSLVKHAPLPMLKRNAAVVLANAGTADDVDVLTSAFEDEEPLVREQAAWALGVIGTPAALEPLRAHGHRDGFRGAGRVPHPGTQAEA